MNQKTTSNANLCDRSAQRRYTSLWNCDTARRITGDICATYEDERGVNHIDGVNMPQSDEIIRILELILETLFPGYTGRRTFNRAGLEFAIGTFIDEIMGGLTMQIERALAYRCRLDCESGTDCLEQAETAAIELLQKLPAIREILKTDVQAALDGDPAARSTDEIVIAYPGLRAIAAHRIAHELYQREIPLIPRVISEHAHSLTGIDIHPGATIGHSFFIDHGTGVVVGETATLGDQVKIYQGVTLGALSFPKDERGKLIKGGKRHPNIEDNVTIYAGATILGDITIGRDSIIGGNTWLTKSLPPNSKVTIASPEMTIVTKDSSGRKKIEKR